MAKGRGVFDLVRDWWQGVIFKGSSSYNLMEKIKAFKAKLKSWNKEVFGRVDTNKRSTLTKISY